MFHATRVLLKRIENIVNREKHTNFKSAISKSQKLFNISIVYRVCYHNARMVTTNAKIFVPSKIHLIIIFKDVIIEHFFNTIMVNTT